ncbi:hypothetical protein F511_01685 [Dorcoceras hygrometricum]|nr:hypothetical protein F511_01685 [Dorcoceras hygrometricum]
MTEMGIVILGEIFCAAFRQDYLPESYCMLMSVFQQSSHQKFKPRGGTNKEKSSSSSSGSDSFGGGSSRVVYCGQCGGKHLNSHCTGLQGSAVFVDSMGTLRGCVLHLRVYIPPFRSRVSLEDLPGHRILLPSLCINQDFHSLEDLSSSPSFHSSEAPLNPSFCDLSSLVCMR